MVAALLVVAGSAVLLVRGSDGGVTDGGSVTPGRRGAGAAVASAERPTADPGTEEIGDAVVAAAGGALDPRKVAVLPFRALGPDEEGRAFALGVHDDILTRLSKIRDLRVISRTSVMEYEDTPKNIREIASELGAAALVEGGVQRAGGQVRLNVQLIDARSDTHLWAETYDREWSLASLFTIQTEIAERVAVALQATLSAEERARLGERPTTDSAAYELFQRARRHLAEQELEAPSRLAAEALEAAVRLDPAFAEAFALLGYTHAGLYWFHFDHTPRRLRAAKAAIDSALSLDPELPDAHVALGYYWYWGHLDYRRALNTFEIAERAIPGDQHLLLGIASVKRRQGRMEEAVEYFRRAREVSPRDARPRRNLAETLALLRRFGESERELRATLDLRPESPTGYIWLAIFQLQRGALSEARAVLERARDLELSHPALVGQWVDLLRLERDFSAALSALERMADAPLRDDQFRYIPVELAAAEIHAAMGTRARAEDLFEAAAERLDREVETRPEDPRLHGALGLALAGLGRAEEAIGHGERAVELLPPEKEAWRGAYRLEELARIHATLGRARPAVELLERLLSMPGDLTRARLRLDPVWDPIRDDPRFRALARGES